MADKQTIPAAESPARAPGEVRRVMALAWPVIISNLQWIILNLIDTAMVGQAATQELAYLAAGRVVTWVGIVIGMGLMSGIVVYTARAHGAGNLPECGERFRQGQVYAALLGLFFLAFFAISTPYILAMFQVPREFIGGGTGYVLWMLVGYPFQFAFLASVSFLEGISRPRIVMVISIATFPINAALNYLFIYGVGPFPEMGASGAALGTSLTSLVSAVAIHAYVWTMRDRAEYGLDRKGAKSWRGAWKGGSDIRHFGIAPGLASGLELAGFSILAAFSTRLGAATAGAFQVVTSLHMVSIACSVGMAVATGVRVGNAFGEERLGEVARRGWIGAGLAAATLLPFAALFVLAPQLLAYPFTDDAEVVAIAAQLLMLLAPFIIFDGSQFVLLYALRAAGDQIIAAVLQVTAFFVTASVVAWLLTFELGLGAPGLTLGLGAGMVMAFLLMTARFAWVSGRLRETKAVSCRT